jgi:hypothetical protein
LHGLFLHVGGSPGETYCVGVDVYYPFHHRP